MEQIKIILHVPMDVALKAGKTGYGETTYAPSEADLALLSEDERCALSDFSVKPLTLATATVAWNAVVEALRAKRAKDAAEIENAVKEMFHRYPEDDQWITDSGCVELPGFGHVPGLPKHLLIVERVQRLEPMAREIAVARWLGTAKLANSYHGSSLVTDRVPTTPRPLLSDPRVAERVAELKREAAENRAQYETAEAAKEAAKKAAEAAKEAAKDAAKAALRELALAEPDLQRAATEGYAVYATMLERIVNALVDRVKMTVAASNFGNHLHCVTDTSAWSDPPLRSSPSPEVFALLDAVTAAVEASPLPPALGAWKVSKIHRIDVCPHEGHRHFVTAVLATLDTPLGLREITFSPESLECTHPTDDSDSDDE